MRTLRQLQLLHQNR
ncbi:hypothetical protein FT202_20990 [Escherichia coli]|nr:hypothetical protein [Escherichia coli]EFC6553837.1 hypothetical protein [Escherichia coli]EFD7008399.1 hypothetical protein [Escherichia coli]EFH7728877.1 hypothetical protein [Escherichia coli]